MMKKLALLSFAVMMCSGCSLIPPALLGMINQGGPLSALRIPLNILTAVTGGVIPPVF